MLSQKILLGLGSQHRGKGRQNSHQTAVEIENQNYLKHLVVLVFMPVPFKVPESTEYVERWDLKTFQRIVGALVKKSKLNR